VPNVIHCAFDQLFWLFSTTLPHKFLLFVCHQCLLILTPALIPVAHSRNYLVLQFFSWRSHLVFLSSSFHGHGTRIWQVFENYHFLSIIFIMHKGIVHPKRKIPIIYSPSCHSKPVWKKSFSIVQWKSVKSKIRQ